MNSKSDNFNPCLVLASGYSCSGWEFFLYGVGLSESRLFFFNLGI